MQRLDVLPVLLEQRHQEVHGQVDVLGQLLLRHLHIAHGHVQAKNLLHLELDGGLEVQNLGVQVIGVGDQGGELTGLERKGLGVEGAKLEDMARDVFKSAGDTRDES